LYHEKSKFYIFYVNKTKIHKIAMQSCSIFPIYRNVKIILRTLFKKISLANLHCNLAISHPEMFLSKKISKKKLFSCKTPVSKASLTYISLDTDLSEEQKLKIF